MTTFDFSVPCRIVGGSDRGASDWSEELARAEAAAEATLERLGVTWNQALLGAIADSEDFDMADGEAAYHGQAIVDLKRWADAYTAAENDANDAAALPRHCIRAGISVALGEP